MSGWKKTLVMVVAALMATQVVAQEEAGQPENRSEGENGRTVSAGSAADGEDMGAIEVQMREAEERLAAAAARLAELSSSRLPQVAHRLYGSARPALGITIGHENGNTPVEGVAINGVTPGSAAAEAGLRAGDVITSINGESFSADESKTASRRLLDFMEGVEEGDTLDVEYLRNGRTASAEVKPRSMPEHMFAFRSGNRFGVPGTPAAPGAPPAPNAPGFFSFFAGGGSWGDMEMVSLTEDLGRYFGADKGLLVVRAPEDQDLKLRDGDVIQRIDGREPTSVSHAMRILGSYQNGETLKIEIMRDRKRQTLSIAMPDNRQSRLREFRFAAPAPMTETSNSATR